MKRLVRINNKKRRKVMKMTKRKKIMVLRMMINKRKVSVTPVPMIKKVVMPM